MAGVAFRDYLQARLIVVWGANPSASGIHLVPIIRKAKQNGSQVVVVDPRRTQLAKLADIHLGLRPGTDLPVALSIINWVFENGHADDRFLSEHTLGRRELAKRAGRWDIQTAASVAGVEAGQVLDFAELYANSSPAVIRCGWGLERNRNGGSAVAAVLALPAVAGKFGVRGGGYTMSNSGAWEDGWDPVFPEETNESREVNINRLGRELLEGDPPIKSVFIYNCNPVATFPQQGKVIQGLEREDLFTVVFDSVMTDSARYADVMLPATTFLEQEDLAKGYGAMILQKVTAVIEPIGESRSNFEVFAELGRRFGIQKGDGDEPESFIEKFLALTPDQRRAWDEVQESGYAFPSAGFEPVQFRDVFPRTTDGKIHLVPEWMDAEAPLGLYAFREDPGSAEYPLAMISPATNKTISSTFGQLIDGQVPLEMHSEDASERGIETGDEVKVFNENGEVVCPVRTSSDVCKGTVVLPKGLWRQNTFNGYTSNALVPDSLTDVGAGACFNDARVQVRLSIKPEA
jgi:anaerobic selenocysteine-containing dehydrogenase